MNGVDRPALGRTRLWILSLAANVLLLAVVTFRMAAGGRKAADVPGPESVPRSIDTRPARFPALPMNPVFPSLKQRWSDPESSTDGAWVAHLRALGLDEESVQDLLTARLLGRYPSAPSGASELADSGAPPDEDSKRSAERVQEQDAILTRELGRACTVQDFYNVMYLQVFGVDLELLFLPAERREVVLAAWKAALAARGEPDQPLEDPAQERVRRESILRELLSPGEFSEYEIRHSPGAQHLRRATPYFEMSMAEFQHFVSVANAARTPDPRRLSHLLNEAGQREFEPVRAAEFQKAVDVWYSAVRHHLAEQGKPAPLADECWPWVLEARQALAALKDDPSLEATERAARAREIRTATQARLVERLGRWVGSLSF